MTTETTHAPIFIVGILPRSGTNFLSDLICLHPDCDKPSDIGEDFVTALSDPLQEYAERLTDRWNPPETPAEPQPDEVLQALGQGITQLINERVVARRAVTKTPRVTNLDRFFTLFPDAYLLIIVRDGRTVVESGVRSFKWVRDIAIHRWARAARMILSFEEAHGDEDKRYKVVRYERLFTETAEQMREILQFLKLPAHAYDFDAAANLPIRGSSEVRADDKKRDMNWHPVERTERFNPLARAADWSRARHERFNWVAGAELRALGYEEVRGGSGRVWWTIWNLLLDVRWTAMRLGYPIARRALRLIPGKTHTNAPRSIDG